MNKEFGIPFVAISILGLILTPAMISVNADEIQSPRQQMASGACNTTPPNVFLENISPPGLAS